MNIVSAPKGVVSAQCMPPIRATQTLKPVKITEPAPGVFIYDFGQNFSGHAQLTASAPTGAKVVMKYGERLAEDGTLDRKDIEQHVVRTDASQSFQTDSYMLQRRRARNLGVALCVSRVPVCGSDRVSRPAHAR